MFRRLISSFLSSGGRGARGRGGMGAGRRSSGSQGARIGSMVERFLRRR